MNSTKHLLWLQCCFLIFILEKELNEKLTYLLLLLLYQLCLTIFIKYCNKSTRHIFRNRNKNLWMTFSPNLPDLSTFWAGGLCRRLVRKTFCFEFANWTFEGWPLALRETEKKRNSELIRFNVYLVIYYLALDESFLKLLNNQS